ncbi:MAG TPA: hypothetical protein PKM44_11475 [Turneriella sp.]|nr:hypothetical protein [Turneriella sp.]HNE20466.1 hypothetical protein [Turneriella sp.]HNJ67168.1 hypothetical protein [Turneriella sp.]HNL11124.1 hypothetical protein [Turneriella sp.]HNL55068.1 hypothetical protein [Turneriella sp.]
MIKELKNVHHRLPWFGVWRIRRRINKVTARLFQKLRKDSKSLVEYGNLRRGKPWGLKEGRELVWTFLVDLLADRPLIYKVVYNADEARYTCYSRSGGRNEMTNVLQFTSDDIDELVARLNMLAAEIPAMRERMLRQHLYALKSEKSPKRWLDLFRKRDPAEELQTLTTLREVVQSMLAQNKISKNEALKLMAYAETLHDD